MLGNDVVEFRKCECIRCGTVSVNSAAASRSASQRFSSFASVAALSGGSQRPLFISPAFIKFRFFMKEISETPVCRSLINTEATPSAHISDRMSDW
jgi:hypothetical protein